MTAVTPKAIKDLTPQQAKIISASVEIQDKTNPLELGFVCRSMVTASMPHSKVKSSHYKRKSNNFTLSMVSNDEGGGLPYGSYPRLILFWLASEVVKSKSRDIVLGRSLSQFMHKLGLAVTGGRWGTISRFKHQLQRLFSTHISFTYHDKKQGEWITANMNIADKAQIFWDPAKPEQIDLFKSQIKLGEIFYDEIVKAPIPVDIRAIKALKNSSLALDIYFWLTYRLGYLSKPVEISYEQLQLQFGGGYKDTKQGRYSFKKKFLAQLNKIETIYPAAKLTVKDSGLLLMPSKSHIPKSYPQKQSLY